MRFSISVGMSDVSHVLPTAIAADELGFDTVAIPDSVFYPKTVSAKYPYTPDGSRFWQSDLPFLDPWVAIPTMAAMTKRVHFYTGVMKFPLRHPILVAKTVGAAAVLSNNRVELGVGLSWIPEEFKFLGYDYHKRGKMVDEGIQVVRLIHKGGMQEFHGQIYDFDPLQVSPAPTKPVPIHVGGHTEAAMKRAAKLGDGIITISLKGEDLPNFAAQMKALRKQYGKEKEPFRIFAFNPKPLEVGEYRRLEELGITDFSSNLAAVNNGKQPVTLEEKKEAMKRFAGEILVKVKR